MDRTRHWQSVYQGKASDAVSWFRPRLDVSLACIDRCKLAPTDTIVDVGGGAATLVDDLYAAGHRSLLVLDLSAAALALARNRLSPKPGRVAWVVADAIAVPVATSSVSFWHDRAVFHFLNSRQERVAYCAQAARCVRPGGYALIATFGLDGPDSCSGLPVTRYSAAGIASEFEADFEFVEAAQEAHLTPWGSEQPFAYALLRRRCAGPTRAGFKNP